MKFPLNSDPSHSSLHVPDAAGGLIIDLDSCVCVVCVLVVISSFECVAIYSKKNPSPGQQMSNHSLVTVTRHGRFVRLWALVLMVTVVRVIFSNDLGD